MKMISKILISAVKFYQKSISPYTPGCCRFVPTCSNYAIEAIRVHGALKGTALSIWRILRCHPLSKGGYDPVPTKKQRK